MAWWSPITWSAGQALTAAQLNQQLRDNMNAIGTWTAYTPAWTATTNPAIGNGVIGGAYIKAGSTVLFRLRITPGSTTTFGSGGYTTSLPLALADSPVTFQGGLLVPGTGWHPLWGLCGVGGTTMDLATTPATAGTFLRAVSSTVPVTFASGHSIAITGSYQTSA